MEDLTLSMLDGHLASLQVLREALNIVKATPHTKAAVLCGNFVS